MRRPVRTALALLAAFGLSAAAAAKPLGGSGDTYRSCFRIAEKRIVHGMSAHSVAGVLYDQCECFYRINECLTCIDYSDRALAQYRSLDEPRSRDLAKVFKVRGDCYFKLKQFELALQAYQEGIDLTGEAFADPNLLKARERARIALGQPQPEPTPRAEPAGQAEDLKFEESGFSKNGEEAPTKPARVVKEMEILEAAEEYDYALTARDQFSFQPNSARYKEALGRVSRAETRFLRVTRAAHAQGTDWEDLLVRHSFFRLVR